MIRKPFYLLAVVVLLLLSAVPSRADLGDLPLIPMFGKTYTVPAGGHVVAHETVAANSALCDVPGVAYQLVVTNGNPDGTAHAPSGSIALNGLYYPASEVDWAGPSFKMYLPLAASNTLDITLDADASDAATVRVEVRRLPATETSQNQSYSIPASSTRTFTSSFDLDVLSLELGGPITKPGAVVVTRTGGFSTADTFELKLNGGTVATRSDFGSGTGPVVKPVELLYSDNQLQLDVHTGALPSDVQVRVLLNADDVGPAIDLEVPIITGTSPLQVSGTVFDLSGCTSLTINDIAAVIDAEGNFTASVPLGRGANLLGVVAYDCAGNGTRANPTVYYDADAPTVTVTTPAANAFFKTTSVNVTGTWADDGILPPLISVNGVNATVLTNHTWSATVTLPAGDGAKTLSVVATDRVGRATTVNVPVTLDTTPPSISGSLAPAANAAGWNRVPVTVSFSCSDSSGIANCTAPITTSTEGESQVTGTATDAAGNTATTQVTVRIDTVRPIISAVNEQPMTSDGWATGDISFHYFCGDTGSGIETCEPPVSLLAANGQQTITGTATDRAGNSGTSSLVVKFDTVPPVLQVAPAAPATRSATLALHGTASDAQTGLFVVKCGGTQTTVTNGAFDCSVLLASGANSVEVLAVDKAGNETRATQTVLVDRTAPTVTITSPAEGVTTSDGTIVVSGTVTDDDQLASITVGGVTVPAGSSFSAAVPLLDGANAIEVRATDRATNTATAQLNVTRFAVPQIAITTPADLVIVRDAAITVTGTIDDPAANVMVNDVAATIANGHFTAVDVPLQQGRTVITATATNTLGRVTTSTINVYRDSIPPRLSVYSPEDGATVYSSPISVSGMVDDIVVGTINATQMRVTINGQPAQVSNRAFLYRDLVLAPGLNTILITAIDEGNNQTTYSYHVTLATPVTPKLMLVSGDGQTAAIGTQLASPVVVQAIAPNGTPLANAALTFRIIDNDGTLHAGASSGRVVQVTTGADGKASVQWTLGNRAGAGNNRMQISGDGFAAPIETAAVGLVGTPALIVVDAGNDQFTITGEPLPRPLVAVVVDAGNNRLANVPVTFQVTAGDGSFEGQSTVVITTDSDGRAVVRPSAGATAGEDNNVYTATVAGVTTPATFRASGRLAGLPENTRITGVILDNTQIPIPGVTVRIDGTSVAVQTNAQGQFTIQPAPVGYVKLFVDGSTAQRPGTWPTLEYALHTLAGTENTVGMPIYLLPIDTVRGLFVDDTTGGTLTLDELPGFALQVAPGSVTFPGGGRTGTISATLVHSDRIPMAPGFGQQPQFIITIQPPGAHFDPPARLTFPNVDGLAAGEITELYSFDHDLGQFVAIGTATVSADGTTLTSDPGVGIIKGGWHCGGNPATAATCDGGGGGGCDPLPGGAPGECRGPNPCLTYMCDDEEGCIATEPFKLIAKYVDRDDASRGWNDEIDLPDNAELFGGWGGDTSTADFVRFSIEAVKADEQILDYKWSLVSVHEPTIEGPFGPRFEDSQWKIEGVMWKPGQYVVECRVRYRNGCTRLYRHNIIVGIRTAEYVAFGAILREDFPAGLDTSFDFRSIWACPFIAFRLLSAGKPWPNPECPKECGPEPMEGMSHDERMYVLYRIIQTTSDELIEPNPNGQATAAYGLSPDRNYRFFIRAQFKFVPENGSFGLAPRAVLTNVALIGKTTAPCGTSWTGLSPAGMTPPENGRTYFENGTYVYQVVTRAAEEDQLGYERLTHRTLPFVGVRFRFRPDSPRLASNLTEPSMSWEFNDGKDYSVMPTISFYRRYWDGAWKFEMLQRTQQQLQTFTGLGPQVREGISLP